MFQVDPFARTPVYEQIVSQVERLVLTGVYEPLDQVPSVRALALDAGVNPNTIQKAYMQLEREGILQSAPGKGRFVTMDAKKKIREKRLGQLDGLRDMLVELAQAGITRAEIESLLGEVFGDSGRGK